MNKKKEAWTGIEPTLKETKVQFYVQITARPVFCLLSFFLSFKKILIILILITTSPPPPPPRTCHISDHDQFSFFKKIVIILLLHLHLSHLTPDS